MASTSTVMDVDPLIEKAKERDDEINKIIKIIDIIIPLIGDEKSERIRKDVTAKIIDLAISDEISGVLMTVFTCLRKEEHDKAGHERYLSYLATIDGTQISIQAIVEKVKADGIKLNFLVATPIVDLMTLFKDFFVEVRTGVTRFRVRKSVAKRGIKRDITEKGKYDDKDRTHSISQYGLVNDHIPLVQGITLAPERRTGVVRSLGPMTQAILLVLEDKYHSKLANALTNSIQMLPMCQEIVSCLKEVRSPGQVQGILKELGDILILTTARSTQKAYFPLLLIYNMWLKKPASFNWSFSGAPMMKLYNHFIVIGMKFKMRSGADALRTSEVVFHAMYGTYLDDLNILSQITNHAKWFQRKDLNTVFHKRSSKNKVEFLPISFKYVSKMAQSLLTKSLGNIDPVATSRPSFSGFRKRTFTQEFLTYLQSGKASHNFSNDPLQLQFALKKTKDSLVEDKDSVKLLHAGTKEWEEFKDGDWIPSTFVPSEGNLKFYGVGP